MPDTDPGLLLQIALIAAPSPSYSAVTSPPVYFVRLLAPSAN